jgi:signal transduction histidine kinase
MKIRLGQEQLPTPWAGGTNPRGGKSLNGPLTGFGSERGNYLAHSGRGRSRSDDGLAFGLSQVVGTLPCAAVIEERNRLAREIHDTLAQEFAGILLHLEAANGSDKAEGQNLSECLARARELAKCGLEDARRMLLGLRPKSLEGAHLADALRQLAECFSRDCGINCLFTASGRAHRLPEDIENELYRVTQEALCNVRKHSRAASVSILLGYRSAGVVLAIKDNGRGFAATQHQPGARGFGLTTMCDRAHRLGGRMDIDTAPGAGTELRMTVPLPGETSMERSNQ